MTKPNSLTVIVRQHYEVVAYSIEVRPNQDGQMRCGACNRRLADCASGGMLFAEIKCPRCGQVNWSGNGGLP